MRNEIYLRELVHKQAQGHWPYSARKPSPSMALCKKKPHTLGIDCSSKYDPRAHPEQGEEGNGTWAMESKKLTK